ncbi:Uncharacterised protein [Vibrio cholerae]|nr:Uncharacterised protein [Vibrio cholerae]
MFRRLRRGVPRFALSYLTPKVCTRQLGHLFLHHIRFCVLFCHHGLSQPAQQCCQ